MLSIELNRNTVLTKSMENKPANKPTHQPAQLVNSQGFEYGVKHFYNQKAGLLSNILQETLNISHEEALFLLNLGSIYVNNQRQFNDEWIHEPKVFRAHTKPRRFPTDYLWQERVIFENKDFIILNKPGNLPSHPSVDNLHDNSLTQLEMATKQKLYITHRLDTLTEGLIVYAKNLEFVKAFNILLQNRQIDKKYSAICETENILPYRLIHYMKPSPRAPKEVSEIAEKDWLMCELEIQDQKTQEDLSRLKINLLTGRTHQIRAQLAAMNASIIGDSLYGSKNKWLTEGIALRACELQFAYLGQIFQFNLPELELV